MPFGSFLDRWVVDKVMFEFVSQGGCQCCGMVHAHMGAEDFMALCSDVNTDDGKKEKLSPWPKYLHDQIWADRVKLRRRLKNEAQDFKQKFNFSDSQALKYIFQASKEENPKSEKAASDVEENVLEEKSNLEKLADAIEAIDLENKRGRFLKWWNEEMDENSRKKCFVMPKSELTEILVSYDFDQGYQVLLNTVIEQVEHFEQTLYEPDGESQFEIAFESCLEFEKGYFTVHEDYTLTENTSFFFEFLLFLTSDHNLPKKDKVIEEEKESECASETEDEDEEEEKEESQSFRGDRLQGYRGENPFITVLNEENLTSLFSNAEPTGEGNFFYDYIVGIVPLIGPGFLLLGLSLFFCPFFFIARCCCSRRCCKPKKEVGEYSFMQVTRPVFFYLFFATLSVAFAILAVSNLNISIDGLLATLCETDHLLDTVSDFVTSLTSPFVNISHSADSINDDVSLLAISLTETSTAVDALSLTLSGTSTYLGDSVTTLDSLSITIDTSSLTTIISVLSQVQSELNTAVGNDIDTYQQTADDYDASSSSEDLEAGINFTDSLEEMFSNFTNVTRENFFEGTTELIEAQFDLIGLGGYLLYFTVFLSFAVGIIVILVYLTPFKCDDAIGSRLLSISTALTYGFMIMMFLSFSINFPLGIVFTDICGFLEIVPKNFTRFYDFIEINTTSESDGEFNFSIFDTLESCFGNDSRPILGQLGFDFAGIADEIDTSELSNIASMDTASLTGEFDELLVDFSTASTANFQVNSSSLLMSLSTLNTVASDGGSASTYTESDCTITDSCDRTCVESTSCAPQSDVPNSAFHSDLSTARTVVIDSIIAVDVITNVLAYLVTTTGEVSDDLTLLEQKITHSLGLVKNVVDEAGGMKAAIASLDSAGDCSFVGDAYYALHGHLCDTSLNSMILIAVFNLLMGICAVPLICCAVTINVRLFGVGAAKNSATVFTE
eukprot:augustus_masked-scaffold_25-processed-gene-2.17-mRNA-1 protein AED:1.00 eAED:1.00 QI:0/0/0/0/1/1/2/0/952